MRKQFGGRGAQCLLFAAALLAAPMVYGQTRVWKSKSGDYEVQAEIVSADAEAVRLLTEDGRTITVPLAKLSEADREYVAAGQTTSEDTEKTLKQLVGQFYRAVTTGRNELRKFLTEQGQDSYDRSPAFFADIRGPDRGQRPRVTSVKVNEQDQTAVADYRIRIGGKSWRMQMLLVTENDQWRVSGIVGPGEDGQQNKMSFDDAQTITDTATSSAAVSSAGGSPPSAADQARGAAAFTKGFCAKCHGNAGTGTRRGPDLTDSKWIHCDGSVTGIREVLVTGISKDKLSDKSLRFGMNPVTNLIPESELDALAEYVKSLSGD